MAYPVLSSAVTSSAASGSTISPTLPSGIVDNDLVVFLLTQDGGGTTISLSVGSGWTVRNPGSVSGATRCAFAYKICSAGESTPTFSGAGSGAWAAVGIIVKDADTSTPINTTSGQGYAFSDFTATTTASNGDSPTLTPAAADDDNGPLLVLYGWGLDGNQPYMRVKQDSALEIGKTATSSGSAILGYRVMATADGSTAAPTVRMYSTNTAEGGNGFALAIRNKSSGSCAADCRTGLIEQPDNVAANWYGDFGSAVTSSKPDDFAATINSITVRGTKATESTVGLTVYPWGRYTTLADSTASVMVGRYEDIATTDITGKLMTVQWYCSGGAASSNLDTAGCLVGFKDNSGNWVVYQLRAKAQIVALAEYTTQIALGYATAYASSGTINWADVTGIGWFLHHGSSATSITLGIKNLCFLDTAKITGGSSTVPASFTTLTTAISSWGHGALANLQGAGQVMGKYSVQVGDGSTPTYFDASTQAFTYPAAYSATTQPDWNVQADRLTFGLYPSSADTINLGAFGAVAPVQQALTMHASASTSASVSVNGGAFVGWNGTWKDGIPITSATFQSCDPFNTKGTDCTNTTWKRTTAGAGEASVVVDTSGSTLDGCTIDVTGTSAGYHLELGTAVTAISLANVTFTGSATDKVHVLKTLTNVAAGAFVVGVHYRINTVGTTDFTLIGASSNAIGVNFTATGVGSGTGTADQAVKITTSGTTSLAESDCTTAGAPVWVATPAIYQEVQITNLVTGSRVQIYDLTNDTELANEIASGTTVTWTDGTAYVADRDIRVRISYVSGTTAKEFIEAEIGTVGDGTPNASTLTYRANQVADSVYNDNAVNGSAVTGVTFTDSSVDVMNIDVAANSIGWPSIYAAWVYYAFSETGIATDIDYIEAVDTANYLLSNLVVKNTSSPSEPLEITGGYGRDATTLAAIDLVDTSGGTIVMAPDHVVSYAVGSGVTSQDKVDIAAEVLSQASSAPIHANVQKVIDLTISGSGIPPTYDSEGNLTDPGDPFVAA